ncbi:hypothetical protein BH09SUM1_BH09SUM1_32640 [soil metagenome]
MPIHAEDLRRYLADATGRPIDLRINDNLTSLISSRKDGPGIRISLHRMFLDAEEPVLAALAKFVHNATPEVHRVIREYINVNQERIVSARAAAPHRVVRGHARGKRFDLQARADVINKRLFRGELQYRIIWGKPARGGKRGVTLGTWSVRQKIIRIHPMLDIPGVPAYMIDFVIYHEMTHVAVPSQTGCSGRMAHHTKAFYAVERAYPLYEEAKRWEKRWLSALMRAWNGGAPLPDAAGKEIELPLPSLLTAPPEKSEFQMEIF